MSFFEAEDISIRFGGVQALHRVSFAVNRGEVFSIIGPNGAGKTTIFNCINRYYDLDEGAFRLEGRDISKVRPHVVADLGIARTFQNVELFNKMSVIDNLLLGRHRRRRSNVLTELLFTGSVRDQELESRRKAEEIIDFLDLQAHRDQLIENLPFGIQKTVELGRALTMEPVLLLLDEPSSGMTLEETEELAFWITDIKAEFGVTILMVEHNMGFVREISDRILAVSFGEAIASGSTRDVLAHPDVLKAYLGDEDAFAQG
ncbi:MAG: ABC transporter ATP-binding protein [Desulfobacterales bacterium]